MKRLLVVLGLAALLLTGCAEDDGGKDARVGQRNNDPANIVNMPEGYPDVATKCSGIPGRRVWVVRGRGGDTPPVITTDEDSC